MIELQSSVPREELEAEVDKELDAFSQWMEASNKGGALSRPERAILKTYFAYKLGVTNGA